MKKNINYELTNEKVQAQLNTRIICMILIKILKNTIKIRNLKY